MFHKCCLIISIFVVLVHSNLQNCPKEVSYNGKISLTWPESPPGNDIESDPPCFHEDKLIKRNCNNTEWSPPLNRVPPCWKAVKYFDLSSCPPGFHKISENNNEYCYEIGQPSVWNYPCFKSGGASIITELTSEDVQYLLKSLNITNTSRYFWLPAQRQKLFNPVIWYIPGPHWRRTLDTDNSLNTQTPIFKNCLLLDIENQMITTETCSKEYPSLCFYLNDLHYPAKCPNGYHSFRFLPDNGTCFGIEYSDTTQKMSFEDFLQNKCNKPMGDSNYDDLTRYIFKKIAQINELPDDVWCWFTTTTSLYLNNSDNVFQKESEKFESEITLLSLEGIINNQGSYSVRNKLAPLPCMACETEMIYDETELILEYNSVNMKLYLTVYFSSSLFKYNNNHNGIQCFSDARGFVTVIDVNDMPFIELEVLELMPEKYINVEKTVYAINLITDKYAQYWCEGHTKKFSLVTTDKIIVNPQGNKYHVFALVVNLSSSMVPENQNFSNVTTDINIVLCGEKVLLMDIFEYTEDHLVILLHVHIAVNQVYEEDADNLLHTFNILKQRAEVELPKLNISLVNISSSIYCLPTTSNISEVLNWDLTLIRSIAAPKEFCLQSNGLPVKRHCDGSYQLGGTWGKIDGLCDQNYKPSATTKFLYDFVKGQMPHLDPSQFLTYGLSVVLEDVNIIIPADIYYLSISLQHIVNIAQDNASSTDMGHVEDIAWTMDRVMVLDKEYLRLSQTLNSTNVILDSVSAIIDYQTKFHENVTSELQNTTHQLCVKPQFVVQVSYPEFSNITGIAIARKTESDKFTDMIIMPLYRNTSLDAILSIENLEIAAWVPNNVLNTLKRNNNESNGDLNMEDIRIVISVFHNDVVFQQLDTSQHISNSRIIGIAIPGFLSNLEHPISILFKDRNRTSFRKFCGYWDFHTLKSGSNPGFWNNKGCFYVKSKNNISVCECYHMTHFGQLLDIGGILYPQDHAIDGKHVQVLNIITLVGSFLSLVGIVGIWITALVFKTWRKKAGTKVLLQLSTAIALPLLLIIVFNLDDSIFVDIDGEYAVAEGKETICIILGAILHYSILASFMWMLITAILQFIRYVRVLGVSRPSRFMMKFNIIGWGIPLIPVVVILVMDAENYVPCSRSRICYPNGFYFVICILLPIFVILVTNITLFILVIYSISRGPDGKLRSTDIDLVGAQLRLSIFLIFLLGLTWIFGIFSFSNSLLWSYLFCLTSTLQGFVIFIYFVICDPETRNLWITLMKPQFPVSITASTRDSVSISSTS